MSVPKQREPELVAQIEADPLTCVLLDSDQYRRDDGAVVVYRDNVQELLHRRLYRTMVNPALRRNHLLRTCETWGCLNPHHFRMAKRLTPRSKDVCPNGHRYLPDNTLPSGHCRTCVEAHRARRKNAPDGSPARPPVTHCPQGHAYTEENTYRYPTQYGWARKCRACTAERNHARPSANVRHNRKEHR